jgi:hypothetical protein
MEVHYKDKNGKWKITPRRKKLKRDLSPRETNEILAERANVSRAAKRKTNPN